MTIRLIDAGIVPYVRSQSLYHGIGHSLGKNSRDTIVLATPASPYICIGNFQDPNLEVNRQFCEENDLPLIRRQTGGGAVYIDKNQLFIQWIFHPQSLPAKVDERFAMFVEPLIQTHKFFGIDAYFHPVNDVHVNGKKIVGTGAATIGNSEVITGNFLFDFDYETMAGALNLPHPSLKQKVFDSLSKYVTTIKTENGGGTPEEWKEKYLEKCKESFSWTWEEGKLSKPEISSVEKWDKKLIDPLWLNSNQRKSGDLKLIKIQSDFWVGISHLKVGSQSAYLQIGMKNKLVEFVQIEVPGKEEKYSEIANILAGVEIDSEKIEERLNSLSNDLKKGLLMNMKEWGSIILKMGKEKDRLSGS